MEPKKRLYRSASNKQRQPCHHFCSPIIECTAPTVPQTASRWHHLTNKVSVKALLPICRSIQHHTYITSQPDTHIHSGNIYHVLIQIITVTNNGWTKVSHDINRESIKKDPKLKCAECSLLIKVLISTMKLRGQRGAYCGLAVGRVMMRSNL